MTRTHEVVNSHLESYQISGIFITIINLPLKCKVLIKARTVVAGSGSSKTVGINRHVLLLTHSLILFLASSTLAKSTQIYIQNVQHRDDESIKCQLCIRLLNEANYRYIYTPPCICNEFHSLKCVSIGEQLFKQTI